MCYFHRLNKQFFTLNIRKMVHSYYPCRMFQAFYLHASTFFFNKVKTNHKSTVKSILSTVHLPLPTSQLFNLLTTSHTQFFFNRHGFPRHSGCAGDDLRALQPVQPDGIVENNFHAHFQYTTWLEPTYPCEFLQKLFMKSLNIPRKSNPPSSSF